VLEETAEDAAPVERVAALDIGKAEVVCCVRVPSTAGSSRRVQEVRTFTTMTRSLQSMGDWLAGLGVTRIVMEATSDYWKPPFYLLEAAGFEVWLVNAREVKHLPGSSEDGQARQCVVVQDRGAGHGAGEFRAAGTDPAAARCHPVSYRSGRGT
jgi:hypothetical protein